MTALSVAKECKIVQPDDQIYMIRPVEDAVSVDPNGIIRPQLTIELCRDTVASLDEDDSINGTVISNADQSVCQQHCTKYYPLLEIASRVKLDYPNYLNLFFLENETNKDLENQSKVLCFSVDPLGLIFRFFRPELSTGI